MNERYNEQDPAPQYDPEAARIRRALRAQKARRRKKMRSRRLFLLGMALIAALVLTARLSDGVLTLLNQLLKALAVVLGVRAAVERGR